jgi:hypothetical protein
VTVARSPLVPPAWLPVDSGRSRTLRTAALVKRDLAQQTVAGLAHLAVEDVAVVFGEESA